MSDLIAVAIWWLISGLLGLLALPTAWRLFRKLPDRGYAFARPIGLLIAAYVYWLGTSLGFLRNGSGSAIAGVVILGAIGFWAGRGRWREFADWFKGFRRTALVMELVFLLAFAAWAFVRANNPEIEFTEKPMELAFLNSILRSPSFPPNDPWLSGFAISYYYFGYILLANLTLLSGVTAGVAFNLGNALWFAIAALGAYSILYNLLAISGRKKQLSVPLLAPLFLLISGNLEGFLDVLWSNQLFWRVLPDGAMQSGFWKWLDIKQLSEPPFGDPAMIPERHLWWWRASRVVRDVNLNGLDIEVIDEFPFFSFLLADNHPHVLALPFAILAIALALQIFLQGRKQAVVIDMGGETTNRFLRLLAGGLILTFALSALITPGELPDRLRSGIGNSVIAGLAISLFAFLAQVLTNRVKLPLARGQFLFASWLFGALAFLNTWDAPIYLVLLMGVVWWQIRGESWIEQIRSTAIIGAAILAAGFVFFLPWYPSFASQAGGILPNFLFSTKPQHLYIMFGVSLTPLLVWLFRAVRSEWRRQEWKPAIVVGVGVPLFLFLTSVLVTGIGYAVVRDQPGRLEGILQDLGAINLGVEGLDVAAAVDEGIGEVVAGSLARRAERLLTLALLGLVLGLAAVVLLRKERTETPALSHFISLLALIGALLIIFPEFLYLKDLFNTRMNTVFKFYFAAWVIWSIAASFAAIELFPRRMSLREIGKGLTLLPLLLGLVYPSFSLITKTNGFKPSNGRTLDGIRHLQTSNPSDYEAITWLNENGGGSAMAEAAKLGSSYSRYGRIAAHTGIPAVIGWDFHQVQWRGTADPQGSRTTDIQVLFETPDWLRALEIIDRYQIEFVYIGRLERETYRPLNERKFDIFMDLVFENAEVKIFARRDMTLQ
jgi:uncharacterized membrane protein